VNLNLAKNDLNNADFETKYFNSLYLGVLTLQIMGTLNINFLKLNDIM
jgi:hypothetical protein